MSLNRCIPDLVASGAIRKADAEKAERIFNRHFDALTTQMAPGAAEAEASARALKELRYAAELGDRRRGLAIKAQQRMDGDMDAQAAKGGNPYGALKEMLRQIEIATQRIEFQSHAKIRDFIQRHRRNLLGQARDKTGMRDFVMERHGQGSGNASAKMFSDAVGEVFESLRQRFNRAGGDIGFRADFGLHHAHDSLRVRKAGYIQWREDILAEIDTAKMIDPLSGLGFTPDRLEEFLFASWNHIGTGGLGDGGSGAGARMLANRRSDHRFFVFKNGEAWLRYNQKYGPSNPFDAVMGQISSMARDIAMMERFGPNPAASWERGMRRAATIDANSAAERPGSVAGTSFGAYSADKMWRYMNGDFSVPVLVDMPVIGPIHRVALRSLQGGRDLITSAFLGSAQLTALPSDLRTQSMARKLNGLPQMQALGSYLRQLNPLSDADRREAVYLGLGMRDATRAMMGIARFMGETHGPGWTQVIADDVLRLSGMNKWTEASQRQFGRDFLRQLAAERTLAWDQLSEARRFSFERNGIGAAEWDAIRGAGVHKGLHGFEYLDWNRISPTNQPAADKLMDMILTETRNAVIETNAETASLMRWGRPGTVSGEIGANIGQFKSFPAALLLGQGRLIAEIGRRHGAAAAGAYLAQFVIGMWIAGAAALQAKEIVKGRDMRPMDNWEFWADAFLQGGGIGIFGDLVGSFFSDRSNSVYSFFGGPMVGLAEDLRNTGAAFVPDEEGAETRGGRATARFLRRYTPGTSLWYTRAAMDRWLWDTVAWNLDPDYYESWDRMERAAEEQGQGLWWGPGDSLPERGPDLANAWAGADGPP